MGASPRLISWILAQLFVRFITAGPFTANLVGDMMQNAAEECDTKGMMLSVPRDQQANEDLLRAMKSKNLTKIWIGARESAFPWRWISDKSVAVDQGCFKDTELLGPDGGELEVYHFIGNVDTFARFRAVCREYCKTKKYKYASLRLWDDISGAQLKQCGCGDTFGTTGLADLMSCPKECPLDPEKVCGTSYHNRIFATEGEENLGYDDSGKEQYSACATLRSFYKPEYGLSLYWSKMTPCSHYRNFLCEVPSGNADCVYRVSATRCLVAVYELRSWYAARQRCRQFGGDLAKVRSHQEAENIRVTFGSSWPQDDPEGFWIGLSRSLWTATDDQPLTFFNWTLGYPSEEGRRCVVMDDLGNWRDEDCMATHAFICTHTPGCVLTGNCYGNTTDFPATDVDGDLSSQSIAIIVVIVLIFVIIFVVVIAIIHNFVLQCTICIKHEPERTVTTREKVISVKGKSTSGYRSTIIGHQPSRPVTNDQKTQRSETTRSLEGASPPSSVYTMSLSQNGALPIQILAQSPVYTEAETLERSTAGVCVLNDSHVTCIVKEKRVVVEEPVYARSIYRARQKGRAQTALPKAPATPPPPRPDTGLTPADLGHVDVA